MDERKKVLQEITKLLDWEFEADPNDISVWYGIIDGNSDTYKIVWDVETSIGSYVGKISGNLCMIKGWDNLVGFINQG